MQRKHWKQFPPIMKQSIELILLTKWLKKNTCKTGTQRRPIHSFQNTLDLAAINAWVLYKEVTNKKISCRTFIRKLAEELAEPQAKKRNGGPGQAVPSQTRSSEREA